MYSLIIWAGTNIFMILLDFVAVNICVYFQYLFVHLSMRQYFWRNCFNLRFKINVVVVEDRKSSSNIVVCTRDSLCVKSAKVYRNIFS